MRNIPNRIFLQIGEDSTPEDDFEKIALDGSVTWCSDRVNGSDIEYVLAKQSAKKAVKIKPWKVVWMVINASGYALPWTISGTKKGALSNLYDDMSAEQKKKLWEENLKKGYCAVKVNVNFELC